MDLFRAFSSSTVRLPSQRRPPIAASKPRARARPRKRWGKIRMRGRIARNGCLSYLEYLGTLERILSAVHPHSDRGGRFTNESSLVRKLNSPRRFHIAGRSLSDLTASRRTSDVANDEVIPVSGDRLPRLRFGRQSLRTPCKDSSSSSSKVMREQFKHADTPGLTVIPIRLRCRLYPPAMTYGTPRCWQYSLIHSLVRSTDGSSAQFTITSGLDSESKARSPSASETFSLTFLTQTLGDIRWRADSMAST